MKSTLPPETPPTETTVRTAGTPTTRVSDLTSHQIADVIKLHQMGLGTRRIGTKLGLSRKLVRAVLAPRRAPASTAATAASKLEPFRETIADKHQQGLTVTRILREITAQGYSGGRTILADYVRTLAASGQPEPKKKVWRRFETEPGEETQFDWSPYRVSLGGRETVVHAFAATLGYSRKTHARFYLNERQSTLLEAHTHAFADFRGVTRRGVYDWMSTVVLGTVGKDRQPLWHPRFQEFARYYGYEPYLCKVADPDRKGKDERFFWYLERDFLRGATFASLGELNEQLRLWLDMVANRRIHGTTRRPPDEAWERERPFLIELPESRFPAGEEELRDVGPDSVLSIRGTAYTVPAALAHHTVSVRLYAEHFEVLDLRGEVVFSRPYATTAEHGTLIIDPRHYDGVRRRAPLPGGSVAELEAALCTRFPVLEELVAGIRRRMKALTHVHLRALWRLADRYGDAAFADAAARALEHRRFDAHAVARILERDHPLPDDDEPAAAPVTAAARVLVALGDVARGSLEDYANLDAIQTTPALPDTNIEEDTTDGHQEAPQETD